MSRRRRVESARRRVSHGRGGRSTVLASDSPGLSPDSESESVRVLSGLGTWPSGLGAAATPGAPRRLAPCHCQCQCHGGGDPQECVAETQEIEFVNELKFTPCRQFPLSAFCDHSTLTHFEQGARPISNGCRETTWNLGNELQWSSSDWYCPKIDQIIIPIL